MIHIKKDPRTTRIGAYWWDNNGISEFAAIYDKKKYLVSGVYSNLDTARNDLEVIDKYVFSNSMATMSIRTPLVLMTTTGTLNYASLSYAISQMQQNFQDADGLAIFALLGCSAASILAGFGASKLCRNKIIKMAASKLSPEAEQYSYGSDAYFKLNAEFIDRWDDTKAEEQIRRAWVNGVVDELDWDDWSGKDF